MTALQSASSKSFTSTPLKSNPIVPRSIPRSRSAESSGDSTYSLLSPIYNGSYESSDDDNEEELKECEPTDKPFLTADKDVLSAGHSRKKTKSLNAEDTTDKLNLSAWEQWVVSKAKEERIRIQQKALELQALKEKKEQEEREQWKKKSVSECKIQEWLQRKRLQEKEEKLSSEIQKMKEILREEQKKLEVEKKADEKYKEWLQKKKQEEIKRKLKEKEELARIEKMERDRKEKAEEKFKEWLKNTKDKDRSKCRSSACSAGGYGNLNYPTPSFVNPIPWKPIHIPQQDKTPGKNSTHRKQPGPPKYQSTPCLSYKPKDTISFACKRR